jgi:hypothetical protein
VIVRNVVVVLRSDATDVGEVLAADIGKVVVFVVIS